jgi:hypothetical protein
MLDLAEWSYFFVGVNSRARPRFQNGKQCMSSRSFPHR